MKYFLFILVASFVVSCKGQTQKKMPQKHKYTNDLIHETSPYLLQHAHNPINWHAWNAKSLALAKKQHKLLLISVGYAACHWCHVMEHESFENEQVAKLMNDNFISIKVDREEHPNVDQVYMNAVQLMTGRGGWPLNCIALPDGKPFWGGTYFRKDDWVKALTQIATLYKKDPAKIVAYAQKLTQGIRQSGLITINNKNQDFTKAYLKKAVEKWQKHFDKQLGGMNRAPKFPMPNNYHFLLRYAHQTKDKKLSAYVNTTLTQMAYGGIFDQVGGGFSRYATDEKWHIPHFEKMLYDNGQLVSLYADAYLTTQNKLYKKTVYQTLAFVERELSDKKGGFYSSLDADSFDEKGKLEEGAFYIWKKPELQKIIGSDFNLFADYYNINSYGYWKDENYQLIRTVSSEEFAKKNHLSVEKLNKKVSHWRAILLKKRAEKSRPRLDDKILTSWNALMLKGYIDAYRVFGESHFLDIALKNASFLSQNMMKKDGSLYRNYKNGKTTINAYLQDYATLIDAYIALYQVTFKPQWLQLAKQLTDYTFEHFFDKKLRLFFFTSDEDARLIARKMETEDNVIPASNSVMAKNLFLLGHFFTDNHYLETAKQMLHNMTAQNMENYASAYSNWLDLYLNFTDGFYEVAISGQDAHQKEKEINKTYIPNKLLCGSTIKSGLPLLEDRYQKNKTLIYVCVDNTCQLPTESVETAIHQIKKK